MVKQVTIKEVRDMSSEELALKLKDLKSELMNLRFQNTINQLANPQRIPEVRKNIAQVMTVMRERELKQEA